MLAFAENVYFMPTGSGELARMLHWYCKVQLEKRVGDEPGRDLISQTAAAPLIGISQPHLSDILSLKKVPETDAWDRIATWLDIKHEDFVARAKATWGNGGKEAYELERAKQDAKRRTQRETEPPATVTPIGQARTRPRRRGKQA